jgi:hypothetical protein
MSMYTFQPFLFSFTQPHATDDITNSWKVTANILTYHFKIVKQKTETKSVYVDEKSEFLFANSKSIHFRQASYDFMAQCHKK